MKINHLIVSVFAFIVFGCKNPNDKQVYKDTPTSGEITIVVDESYKPIIEVQKDTFQDIYKYAKINVRYLPEADLFNELLNNDTIRLAIAARDLTADEKSFFDARKIIPRPLKIAVDAIALIVNKSNPDSMLTYEQLSEIMQGNIITWNQLNKNRTRDSIRIVFDKNGSANARFLNERFLNGKKFPANFYASNSNPEVIEYVSANPGSIGVIGVNWISDKDDSLTVSFLTKINVIALSMPDTGGVAKEYNKPYQAYMALKTYPLLRDVTIISREGRNGLGTGFASFLAGDKGQRLIRLTGLLPATMPVRIINAN